MNTDDIIKFATDAKFPIGFLLLANRDDWKRLERFAALATAAAVAAEREALETAVLKLKSGVAGPRDYIQGRWDAIGEVQDIIRARGEK